MVVGAHQSFQFFRQQKSEASKNKAVIKRVSNISIN